MFNCMAMIIAGQLEQEFFARTGFLSPQIESLLC